MKLIHALNWHSEFRMTYITALHFFHFDLNFTVQVTAKDNSGRVHTRESLILTPKTDTSHPIEHKKNCFPGSYRSTANSKHLEF